MLVYLVWINYELFDFSSFQTINFSVFNFFFVTALNSANTARVTASNYEIKIKTATVPDFQNETDNAHSRKKELCILNMNTIQAKKKKLNDDEKNDIISVEDEIYNLAFRPAKP